MPRTYTRDLVNGVGINDANYVTQPTVGIRRGVCPYFLKWNNMIKRCYDPVCLRKHPAYIGCVVDPSWHRFMAFRSWMIEQDWEGNELDKDLLGDGKIYSPMVCVFISEPLNRFLKEKCGPSGKYLHGVSLHHGRFRSRIQVGNRRQFLGSFETQGEAHYAWARVKSEQALKLSDEQTDPIIAIGLRRYAASIQELARNRLENRIPGLHSE
jgi:hypothetical protein